LIKGIVNISIKAPTKAWKNLILNKGNPSNNN